MNLKEAKNQHVHGIEPHWTVERYRANCGRDRKTGELLLIDLGKLSLEFDEGLESVGDLLFVERATECMETDKKAHGVERLPEWFTREKLREYFFDLYPHLLCSSTIFPKCHRCSYKEC